MSDFITILRSHALRYPQMQPGDAVKLLYQHVFGCGHFVTDEAACLRMLQTEYAATKRRGGPLLESVGNDLYRLNLAAVDEKRLPLPCICQMFMLTSERIMGDKKTFFSLLGELRTAVAGGMFSFGSGALTRYLSAYEREGYPPASHSEVYRYAYHPAYRLIDGQFARLMPLIEATNVLLAEQGHVSVAIDGPAASGKTTAAALLERLYGANIIHMDDFFLPFELRTPQRLAQPGGNVHVERFVAEVLPALAFGGPFYYRVFSCSTGTYSGTRVLGQAPLTVVEGVYSQHPLLTHAYNLRVFFTVPPEEQTRRILERNGADGLSAFEERWIPLENDYFSKCGVQESADLVL